MIDGASPISPLLVDGPRSPAEHLRPAVSAQRVLLLDSFDPRMVDLATGEIRRWENGPPVSVPVISNAFDLREFARLQFQVLRDPRPSSSDLVLLAVDLGRTGIEVVETTVREFEVRMSGDVLLSGPIGTSQAVVIALTHHDRTTGSALDVGVRNAEVLDEMTCTIACEDSEHRTAVLTIGGPSTARTGRHGRRRLTPVHVDVTRRVENVDRVRRIARRVRRFAESVRERR